MNISSLSAFLPLLVVVVVCYLFMFLPESKRRKKYNNMLSSLKVNDQIVTKGGVIGKLINIQDENITIQTGPDRVKLKLTKNSIFSVLSEKKTEEVSKKEDK